MKSQISGSIAMNKFTLEGQGLLSNKMSWNSIGILYWTYLWSYNWQNQNKLWWNKNVDKFKYIGNTSDPFDLPKAKSENVYK